MEGLHSVAGTLSRTRKVVLFGIITCVLFFAFVFYSLPAAFLPLYDQSHDVSSTWTGVLIGAGPLSYVFVCPLSALLLNTFSNKKLYIVPTASLGIVTMLFSLLDFVPSADIFVGFGFLLRIVQGICGGIISVTSFAALVAIYPDRVATVTALAETVLNGALAVGPFLGSVLYATGGFQLAFFVPGLLILLSVLPECFVPQLTTSSKATTWRSLKTLLDPGILFAAWHCSACQILLNYHIPILSPYVERVFGESVVWAGTALMINSGSICLSAPFLGFLIDRYNPYIFLVISSIFLPICYMFIGPLPLLSFIEPSKGQLLTTLMCLGFFVPMGCTPVLLVMFDIYKTKSGGDLPQSVQNVIVSLYCASFPIGSFLGATISGIVAEKYIFEWSTGILALVFIAESLACLVFCWGVHLMKKNRKLFKGEYSETTPIL
ncbi:MFS-type transporter SLC18B1-like [Bolinopsis microptera]|uniref:MFS-type transporter SLC18B1-like n=1 Tax=Bolinopsis microptera TaxID=2820187 RepID=UPI00307A4502